MHGIQEGRQQKGEVPEGSGLNGITIFQVNIILFVH